jgi:hypothetical protein
VRSGLHALDVVGTVDAVGFGRNGFAVNSDVEILRGVCLNGDGSGVDKNAPLEAIAVAHQEENNGGRGCEKGEYEDPEEEPPYEKTHRKEKEICSFYTTRSGIFRKKNPDRVV